MRVGLVWLGAASSQSWITSTHTGHALATIVEHLSNQNSQTHSSESGFRRNVKFATFEEADGLCKNIPHNGVKLAPLGGKSVPKLPHWLETAFQLNITLDHSVIETRGRAHLTQTTNQHLRIIVKLSSHAPSNHLEHLSNTSHRLPLKEIKGISQDRSVIETRGRAHLTQTTNQHLRIIVKLSSHAPSNHLEHLSNTSHRLPLKEFKGISQDISVIETWGWARLTRGSKQPILNHLNTHWPRPSNHCRAP